MKLETRIFGTRCGAQHFFSAHTHQQTIGYPLPCPQVIRVGNVQMDVLVQAYREGSIDMERLRELQTNDLKTFQLEKSVGIRPNPIPGQLNVDVSFLKRMVRNIHRSTVAGKRLGHEWNPTSRRVVNNKRADDDTSFGVDDLKGLNDVCTKWCTHTFFPDTSSRLSFVSSVFKMYTTLSNEFKELKFDLVFKGGVIMRLIILEFVQNFSIHERVAAEEYLKAEKAVSFSDFDFEIVPHNHSPRQDLIIRLFSLYWALLLWLRNQMDVFSYRRKANPLFNISWDEKDSISVLKQHLQKEVDGYDDGHPLSGATIDHVVRGCYDSDPPRGYKTSSGKPTQSKRDNVFIFTRRGETEKSIMSACDYFTELDVPGVPCDYPRDFYCTMNTFIGEDTERERPEQLKSVFHLCRIKQGFVVYLTTKAGEKRCERLGGEMLDLSQSNGTRTDEMRRYIYSNVKAPYREYYMIGSEFHIRSYSSNGLLHDLRVQIHFQDKPPFESMAAGTSKIRKRLLRYLLFMVIYTLGPFVDHSFQYKVQQMHKLLTTTSSVDHLYRHSQSRVAPIDEFVLQEQHTLRLPGSTKKKQAYLASIHRHLKVIYTLITGESRSKETLDERYLEFADTFLY